MCSKLFKSSSVVNDRAEQRQNFDNEEKKTKTLKIVSLSLVSRPNVRQLPCRNAEKLEKWRREKKQRIAEKIEYFRLVCVYLANKEL